MNNPKLYTVKEAAELVGVSTNTLYKYLDENKIKAARGSAIQGRFRIPQTALEEFLGISLSQPEKVEADSTSSLAKPVTETIINPVAESQVSPSRSHLPLSIARFLLILALFAVLLDLVISHSVSLPSQISRLLFLFVMLLLAYQEGGYRRG